MGTPPPGFRETLREVDFSPDAELNLLLLLSFLLLLCNSQPRVAYKKKIVYFESYVRYLYLLCIDVYPMYLTNPGLSNYPALSFKNITQVWLYK